MDDITASRVPLTGPRPVHRAVLQHQASFRAYFFGSFRVFHGTAPVGRGRQRREAALKLLRWFLLNPGRPCSMEELVELCWPDVAPEKSTGNFHVTMHSLRRMLEPALDPRKQSSFIRRSSTNFYRFEPMGAWWTDTGEAEHLFDRARAADGRGDSGSATFLYGRVAALGARQFLEGEEHTWLAPHRKRYEGLYSQALIRLMQLHRARGEWEESLEYAYQMLCLDRGSRLAATVIDEAGHTLDPDRRSA